MYTPQQMSLKSPACNVYKELSNGDKGDMINTKENTCQAPSSVKLVLQMLLFNLNDAATCSTCLQSCDLKLKGVNLYTNFSVVVTFNFNYTTKYTKHKFIMGTLWV